jgi:4-hydroxy-3-polyprenylbenzoate decarboxylase
MDLRDFLSRLAEEGQLKAIGEEVDWNLQAGGVCTMSNRVGGPSVHFQRVKGYPEGYTMAGSLFTGPANVQYKPVKPWGRQAVALGLGADTDYETFIGELLVRMGTPIRPTEVSTGTCKENILTGGDVDVTRFPVPYLHEGDGGRYGTISTLIVSDPETGWQHWGYYRWMVVGPNKLVAPLAPFHAPFLPMNPLNMIYQKHAAQSRPMPFCIVLGGDPAVFLASSFFSPPGTDHAGIAGGLRKDPISLVRAETNDLLVPADAEIVLEGEVVPGEMAEEGPFPEYVRRTQRAPQPVYTIKAITHRNQPIFPFSAEGHKVSDSLSLVSTAVSLELTRACKGMGFPLRWVNCPVETMMALCVASIQVWHSGMPARLARFLFTAHPLGLWFDKVIILDHDVDPVDWKYIMQDWSYKVNASVGVHYLNGPRSYLVDYSNADEKNNMEGTKIYFDTTFPYWWDKAWIPKRLSFETTFPKEIQDLVVERWGEYGLAGKPWVRKPPPTVTY